MKADFKLGEPVLVRIAGVQFDAFFEKLTDSWAIVKFDSRSGPKYLTVPYDDIRPIRRGIGVTVH